MTFQKEKHPPKCLYPVRVRIDVPWDLSFPEHRPCGKPATDRIELAFYLDGYNEKGINPPKIRAFIVDVCERHAAMRPSLTINGPHAAVSA